MWNVSLKIFTKGRHVELKSRTCVILWKVNAVVLSTPQHDVCECARTWVNKIIVIVSFWLDYVRCITVVHVNILRYFCILNFFVPLIVAVSLWVAIMAEPYTALITPSSTVSSLAFWIALSTLPSFCSCAWSGTFHCRRSAATVDSLWINHEFYVSSKCLWVPLWAVVETTLMCEGKNAL